MADRRNKSFLSVHHIIANLDVIIGCVFLICLMLACSNRVTNLIQSASESAKSIGNVVTVAGGDVSVRDIPKALAIKQGHFFGDPHYAGEANWYPFATPLLVAAISHAFLSDQTIDYAYFMFGALTGVLLIAASGGLLCAILGRSGLLTLPICMSLGFLGLQRGVYPYATAHLPMVLYLTIACLICNTMRQCSAKRMNILFSLLGFLNGVLGVWHGASFFTATAISLTLLATFLIIRLRAGSSVSSIVAPIVLYCSAAFLPLSMLIVPQILQYGYLAQSESARLWLTDYYAGGKIPKSFWELALLPTGLNELYLITFAVLFVWSYKTKRQFSALPLFAGYIFAKSLAHFGFVVNCGDMFLSKLARTILLAPPHTFNDHSSFIFIYIKMVALGWIIIRLLKMISYSIVFIWQCMHSIFKKMLCAKTDGPILHDCDRNVVYRDRILRAILLVSLVTAYALLRMPIPETLPTTAVDSKIYDFAQSASRIVGQQTIVGANNLINLAHFNILYLGSPPHSNPYVEEERKTAMHIIKSGNIESIDKVLRFYHVGYAIPNIDFKTSLCKQETILQGPYGYSLVKFKDYCLEAKSQNDNAPSSTRAYP